jgi:hypothetical protein
MADRSYHIQLRNLFSVAIVRPYKHCISSGALPETADFSADLGTEQEDGVMMPSGQAR